MTHVISYVMSVMSFFVLSCHAYLLSCHVTFDDNFRSPEGRGMKKYIYFIYNLLFFEKILARSLLFY